MALWTLKREVFENPSTGVTNSLNDRIASPSLDRTSEQRVDVVSNFKWTNSPGGQASREEVPSIYLTERRLLTNALIAQLKYSLGGVGSGAAAIGTLIDQTFGGSLLAKTMAQSFRAAGTTAQGVADWIATNDDNTAINSSPYLKPYKNLYVSQKTGWRYRMPYFENPQDVMQNQFGTTGASNMLGNLAQGAAEFITGAAELLSTALNPQGITYVERTKFFNYSDDGNDINVTFPLINTGSATYNDVLNNWQLVYLLLLQNRPAKTSINTVEPPVIYEVNIPGIRYIPYAYMSSISVEFQGARREMSLSIPYSEAQTTQDDTVIGGSEVSTLLTPFTIDAIIPDAYIVRFTLHGLNTPTRNFMYHTLYSQRVVEALEG